MNRSLSVASYCALFCAAVLQGWPPNARGQDASVKGGLSPNLHLAGNSIPAPPREAATWKAPETKLSKEFVSATAALFRQGLADPRGCEYREIEVVVGSFEPPWSDTILKTHGWVLPDTGKQAQHFGVCWNGLVYPLASIGKPADMRADAAAAGKGEVAGALCGTGRTWNAYFEDFCLCHPWEGRCVYDRSPLPVKTCLLLRLGEAALAEKVWKRWTSGLRSYSVEDEHYRSVEESVEANKPYLKDPYLVLANFWTLSLFDRAVAAHLRGDDQLALASAETLATAWPMVEAEAAKRGFTRPSPEKIEKGVPYLLVSADRARQLLADQRERAKDRRQGMALPVLTHDYANQEDAYRQHMAAYPKFVHALNRQLARCPDKTHRIALLIHQLREYAADYASFSAPSANQVAADFLGIQATDDMILTDRSAQVIVAFLDLEGEDAVEPLLVCLEKDNRLTRLPSNDEPYPVAVCTVAESTLEQILKMPFHSEPSAGEPDLEESKSRRVDAAKIHRYWTRYKGVPMAERWYRILADDRAEPAHWFAAARVILQPASVPVTISTVTRGWEIEFVDGKWGFPRQVKDKSHLHGDVLRDKTNPSVTELMIRRVKAFAKPYYDLLAKRDELDKQEQELEQRQKRLEQQAEKLDEQPGNLSKRHRRFKQADRLSAEQRKALDEQGDKLDKQREKLNKQREELQEQQDKLSKQQEELDSDNELETASTSVTQSCDMALYLARWDPKAALPLLRQLTAECLKNKRKPGRDAVAAHDLDDWIIRAVLARAAAGDLAALDEYAVWVRDTETGSPPSTRQGSRGTELLVEPFCLYPDHPKLAETAEWLFNDKASPWYLVLGRGSFHGDPSISAFSSPLAAVPAFRKRVLQLLEDRHEIGHIKVVSKGKIALGLEEVRETTTVPDDPLCPPPGTNASFRICDACAYGLSPLEGTPKCELFWPEKERDRAVMACAACLHQYGHCFRVDDKIVDADGQPLRPPYGDFNQGPILMTFPLRDHPATPDDVRTGNAIFSLAGQGKVRVSTMPKLPRSARWTSLKDHPVLKDTWGPSGKLEKTVGYEQEGIVWQAEEVEVGGRWQRFYGFVGRYGLAKVPAEEIEFDDRGLEWIPVKEHFAIGLHRVSDAEERGVVQRAVDSDILPTMLFYHLSQPVIFKVQAFNRSGADQPLPTLVEGPGKKEGSSIPVLLQLRYGSESPTTDYWPGTSEVEPIYSLVGMAWTQMPRKMNERLTMHQIERKLAPTEHFDCVQLELNRLFDVSRPGTYRLSLKLASGKDGAWQENEVVFTVTEKSGKAAATVQQDQNTQR